MKHESSSPEDTSFEARVRAGLASEPGPRPIHLDPEDLIAAGRVSLRRKHRVHAAVAFASAAAIAIGAVLATSLARDDTAPRPASSTAQRQTDPSRTHSPQHSHRTAPLIRRTASPPSDPTCTATTVSSTLRFHSTGRLYLSATPDHNSCGLDDVTVRTERGGNIVAVLPQLWNDGDWYPVKLTDESGTRWYAVTLSQTTALGEGASHACGYGAADGPRAGTLLPPVASARLGPNATVSLLPMPQQDVAGQYLLTSHTASCSTAHASAASAGAVASTAACGYLHHVFARLPGRGLNMVNSPMTLEGWVDSCANGYAVVPLTQFATQPGDGAAGALWDGR